MPRKSKITIPTFEIVESNTQINDEDVDFITGLITEQQNDEVEHVDEHDEVVETSQPEQQNDEVEHVDEHVEVVNHFIESAESYDKQMKENGAIAVFQNILDEQIDSSHSIVKVDISAISDDDEEDEDDKVELDDSIFNLSISGEDEEHTPITATNQQITILSDEDIEQKRINEKQDFKHFSKLNPQHLSVRAFQQVMQKDEIDESDDSEIYVCVFSRGGYSKQIIDIGTLNALIDEFILHNLDVEREIYQNHKTRVKAESNDVFGVCISPMNTMMRYLDIDHLQVENLKVFHSIIDNIVTMLRTTLNDDACVFVALPENIEERIQNKTKDGGAAAHIHIFSTNWSIQEDKVIKSLKSLLGDSFDMHPWTSSVVMLPFCHKARDSPMYKLDFSLCSPSTPSSLREAFNKKYMHMIHKGKTYNELIEQKRLELSETNKKGYCDISDEEIAAIGEGFKDVTIHATHQGKIDECEHLGLLVVCGAIASIESNDKRKKLIQAIQNNAKLTEKATKHFVFTLENAKPTNKGILWSIIKRFNPDFYVENIERFEEFDVYTDKYNFDEFQRDTFESFNDVIRKLKRCIFKLLSSDELIVKFAKGFEKMKTKQFISSFDGVVHFKISDKEMEDKIQRAKDKHRKIPTTNDDTINLNKIIRDFSIMRTFRVFESVTSLSNNKNVLSLYVPPKETPLNLDLIKRFVGYYMRRVKYDRPMREFFDSVCFKLKYPGVTIQKYFIFQGRGHDGKSFLVSAVSEMFKGYGFIIDQSALTNDIYNSWLERAMFVWTEEMLDIGRGDKLVNLIKQLTTREAGRRPMYGENRQGTNKFICGFNTNDKNLAGLADCSDQTLIERLVIVSFNEPTQNDKNEINELSKLSHLNDDENDERDVFLYSLYYYIKNVHVISSSFTPVRYEGPEKDEIITQRHKENVRLYEMILIENCDKLVTYDKTKNVAVIRRTRAHAIVKEWCENNGYDDYKIKTWFNELKKNLKWVDDKFERVNDRAHFLKLPWSDWEIWKQKQGLTDATPESNEINDMINSQAPESALEGV